MALFLSRFDNKVDKKGRVSVPASFRADLTSDAFAGVVAFPSPGSNGAVDGCDIERMKQLSEGIDNFNPFSNDYGDFATVILTKSHRLPFDTEGRIILPPPLLEHAGITDMATFAGRGATFQIWAPEAYKAYEIEATERAKDQAANFELQRRDQLEARK
ncbi:MAG: division/cell wall cluster transcriptional repressor MraZ [Rhodospirillaceae bacterium]|nr:division/cell wall cluster transcriptional repressor MraZ [Rhodospirillaceae bacterium]MBT4490338.1 division/cell wall cluster transcriptional repressor MraZ [Rhodospirillaceae bacterium]MBT5194044.1 division/cell wall cluster transcriptional repressor MraZ [Rhodospirillaceae bacterium]MBT5897950.1 division/cell wall cluster transcriptional repressor MraZ [Rhodospirillaceae bacterium]MBT6429323.1 division/cell wall cluster transcriptional repressor MraZ [Rhodospirillaceae bacterium]